MVSSLRSALQQAVEAGDFAAVALLATEYGESVGRDLMRASSAAERAEILEQAVTTLTGYIHLTRVNRSHVAARFQAVTRQHRYGTRDSRDYTWRLDG
jgi:hypothetical protein